MKNIHLSIALLACLASVEAAQCASPNNPNEKAVYVEVRNTKLKSKPDYLSSNLADLTYGATLYPAGDSSNEAWLKVKSSNGVVGYVHSSALSPRRVVLNTTGSKNMLRSDENPSDIVMAGKGFNKEVEREFAANNPSLNLSAVNSMERLKIGEGETKAFARAGGLLKGGQS